MPKRETHTVRIAGVTRQLPLFAVSPNVSIAVFNMLGDSEIIRAAANYYGWANFRSRPLMEAVEEDRRAGCGVEAQTILQTIALFIVLDHQTGAEGGGAGLAWNAFSGRGIALGQSVLVQAGDELVPALLAAVVLAGIGDRGQNLSRIRQQRSAGFRQNDRARQAIDSSRCDCP